VFKGDGKLKKDKHYKKRKNINYFVDSNMENILKNPNDDNEHLCKA
jgi:hypothetical protein